MKKFILRQLADIKKRGLTEIIRKIFVLAKVLFRFLISSPFYILGIFFCFIIRLLSPWLIIRLDKFPSDVFGNFCNFPATYYCKKKLNIDVPKKKYIDIAAYAVF